MVLTSKITKPSYSSALVERTRLYRTLDRWQSVRGILIHAPAGYGKSSLVSRWIDHSNQADSTAWLSLEQDDSEPRQFVHSLAAALDTVLPGALALVQPILQDALGDARRALARLFAALDDGSLSLHSAAGGHLLLVLDDLHLIQSEDVDGLLTTILERGPVCLHLLLVSRRRTNLPLARLVAHEQIEVLGKDDLRFTEQEISAWVALRGFAPPTESELMRLVQRSEGWVTALQLAALSLRARDSVAELLAALQGKGDWLAAFLADEVLNHQNPGLRRFLLRTSLLDRFNPQLCEAVAGEAHAAARLSEIANSDLFLIQLDRGGHWYRYHHLFQELLQQRLQVEADATSIAALHSSAAEALAGMGQLEDAVRHWLAAGNESRAATLVQTEIAQSMHRDPYRARRLLELLPPALLAHNPRLAVARCRLAMLFDSKSLLQDVRQAEAIVAEQEATEPAQWHSELAVLQVVGHFLVRDFEAATRAAETAQRLQGELDEFLAGTLQFVLMRLHFQSGASAAALKCGQRALAAFERAGVTAAEVALRRELARGAMWCGQGRDAARQFESVLSRRYPNDAFVTRELAWTYFMAADNCHWLDELKQAGAYQQSMMSLALQLQDDELICHARALAEACAAANNEPGHNLGVEESPCAAADAPVPRIYYVDVRVRSLVATARRGEAWNLVRRLALEEQIRPPDYTERQLLPYLHAYIARGVDLEATQPLLEGALAHRTKAGARLEELRLLALTAWQQIQLNDQESALQTLTQAQRLAEETGYLRVLLDIPALVTLLRDRGVLAPFLSAAESSESLVVSGDALLTAQERQVLALLAADHTYQEIAGELVVSINTVRTHVRNLYRKLGVHGREQAIAMASRDGISVH